MTDDNIEAIKARVAELEARLARIEMRLGESRPSPTPPPILFDVSKRPIPFKLARQPEEEPASKTASVSPAGTNPDAEYRLGGQILPWVGAVITILSIGFGVSLAFQHGFITPRMIFGGGVLLCLLFIAFGQWKRDEREEFGQILTGIGACGLYITFAAGHGVQKLFEAETLILLFTVLSLANLGYGFWRSSRAFLILGILGGFAAALMPLDEGKVALSLGLHFLILAPSAAIVFHRRWLEVARGLWVLGLAVLLPGFTHALDWRWQVAAVYGTALICFVAYARSWLATAWDRQGAFGPLMLALSAGLAFALHQGPAGSVHVLLFGGALGCLAVLPWDPAVRSSTALSAFAIPLILAPCGQTPFPAALIFAGLAVALAVGSGVRFARALSMLAGVEFLLASGAYLVALDRGLPWTSESALLGALLVAGIAAAMALMRAWEAVEEVFLGVGLALLPLVMRLAVVVLGLPSIGADLITAETWALVVAGSVLAVFGIRKGWTSAIGLSAGVMILALAGFVFRLDLGVQSVPLELLLLFSFGSALVLTGLGIHRRAAEARASLVAWFGLLLGLVVARALIVVLVYSGIQADPNLAAVLGLCVASLAATVVAKAKALPTMVPTTWILWSAAGAAYLSGIAYGSQAIEMGCLAVLGVSGLVQALAFDGGVVERRVARIAQLTLGWLIFSRLASLLLAQPAFGIELLAGVTVAWTVYAAILLGAGFGRRVDEMRWFGLGVLGCTAVKLIWIDLATTSDLVRFAITLGLGIAMIGGGYLYIRLRDRLGPSKGEGRG